MSSNYNRNNKNKRGRRKKFPLMSVIIVTCFVVITTLFFMLGLSDEQGNSRATPTESPELEATPTPAITATPEPTPTPSLAPPVEVKGIYYIAEFASTINLEACMNLIERTVLNAIVIDVKDDYGTFTFQTDNEVLKPAADAFKHNVFVDEKVVFNKDLITQLKSQGIYTIARVVCFKDDFGSSIHPEFTILNKNATSWRDINNKRWLDPYNRDAWEYIAEACREAAMLGFDEVQLDYVRFPADRNISEISYNADRERYTKTQIINEFVSYIRDEMIKEGVRTSVDIFAIAGISDKDAEDIGQDVGMLLGSAHYLSPMIYPSHFAHDRQNGVGQEIDGVVFSRPDTEPYEVVYRTLQHYKRHIERFVEANPSIESADIRPYLQYFTASHLPNEYWIEYGADEIHAQIEAVNDAGYSEWLLWTISNGFDVDVIP